MRFVSFILASSIATFQVAYAIQPCNTHHQAVKAAQKAVESNQSPANIQMYKDAQTKLIECVEGLGANSYSRVDSSKDLGRTASGSLSRSGSASRAASRSLSRSGSAGRSASGSRRRA
jgi:hypothetical protein